MHQLSSLVFRVWLCLILVFPSSVRAKVNTEKYGVPAPSSVVVKAGVARTMDSVLKTHPQFTQKTISYNIVEERPVIEETWDFYLLLFLILLLGFIRLVDPKYFQTLWIAISNPTLSNRQLKEKLQTASIPNMLMNVFFTISSAAYIYYVVKIFTPQRSSTLPPSLLIVMLIAGMMIIYLGKFAVIRFSGWAFKVESITEHYLFNVFLANKILSIVLLPFIILLAFSDPAWAQPALIISFLLILVLFINRYMRSWQVFGSFFQYSKFHFFTYLCASELLPLAVLMKLLVRGLLY
jgi:hypothetical protein